MKDERQSEEIPPLGAAASAKPASAPLGEWRGPLFWMACGALLAGLAGAAVMLAQRFGVERDMAAVATTLPPRPELAEDGLPGRTAASGPPVSAGRLAAPALRADAGEPGPGMVPPVAPRPGARSGERRVAREDGAALRHGAKRPAGGGAGAAGVRTAGRMRHAGVAPSAAKSTSRPQLRRQPALNQEKYAEVFKRCPAPGQSGSVECRRHICNGAEGKGAACKPYRGKPY